MFLGSLGGVVYNINQVSLRQAITPERIQGRMNATMRFLVWGTIPIGQIIGGILATLFGVREVVFIGGVLGCFAFVPILFSSVRQLEKIPTPAGSVEGPARARAGRGAPVMATPDLVERDADATGPGSALD